MHGIDFLLHALAPNRRLTDSSAVGGMPPFIFPTASWYQITSLIMWCTKQKCESREHVQNSLTSKMRRSVAIKHQRHMPAYMCLCEHAVFACACGCARSYTINRWAASKSVVHVTQNITQLFNAIRVGFHMEKTLKHYIFWRRVVYLSEKLEA